MGSLEEKAADNLAAIRDTKPLIHNITNFVVMNFTANALLAIGASPVMAHSEKEVEEMVSMAGALVLNIGTLTPEWVAAMIKAGRKAAEMDIPVILDPVGAGATSFRTASAKEIISKVPIRVIRGNASEILALRNKNSKVKGVDSIHSVEDAAETGIILAEEMTTTLAITGPVDLITDGRRIIHASNGHPLMGRITGTGCVATATIGAFSAVDNNPLSATATALAFLGLAGEVASENASAPGSFMIGLIDALYTITPGHLKRACKFKER